MPRSGLSATSAGLLIGDALDLRHRLPLLWARLQTGQVKAWVGRKVARATRSHDAAAAAFVDAKVAPYAGTLSWGRLDTLVAAAIAAADPARAKADAEAAATRLGVFRQRSTDHGTVTTILRNTAPDAIWFDASIDRVADALALLGDTRPKDTRRAAAVGVLANPHATLDLYQQAATAADTAAAAEAADAPQPQPVLPTADGRRTAGGADAAADGAGVLARIRAEGGVTDTDLPDPDPADSERRRPPRPSRRRRDPVRPPQLGPAGRWIRGHRSPCMCT